MLAKKSGLKVKHIFYYMENLQTVKAIDVYKLNKNATVIKSTASDAFISK